MTMILVAVDFDAPIALPGKRAETTFPPPMSGWSAFVGWRMYVDGDRLCIVAPAGETSLNKAAQAEMDANGINPKDVAHLVSIPLHRCTLRYAGTTDDIDLCGYAAQVPTPALAKVLRGDAPPPAPSPIATPSPTTSPSPAAPAKKKPPPSPQNNAPQPLRRPPGAKPLVQPPISTEIEVDGQMPKAKRSVMPLESESQ